MTATIAYGADELALMAGCVVVALLALTGDALMLRIAWRGGALERLAAGIMIPLATAVGATAVVVFWYAIQFAQCEANIGGDCL
jgi:hypothetical protein